MDKESENHLVREGCLDLLNLDIIGIVESHLISKDNL